MSHASTAPIASLSVESFLAQLAARQPVPGGGAASSVVLAHAAALGSMVIAYSIDKPALAAHHDRLSRLAHFLDLARSEALALADRDAAAYLALNALWKLPKDQRAAHPEWGPAVSEAIAAPCAISDLALGVASTVHSLEGITTRTLASDLAIALRCALCAYEGGLANVEVNVPLLSDAAESARVAQWIASRRVEAGRLANASATAP